MLRPASFSCRFSASRRPGRKGAVAVWLIFACGVLLAFFALAVNQTRLWSIRVELQNAADAAALASAAVLVDDDLLRGNPAYLPALLQRSSGAGQLFAQYNLVQGSPFVLQPNPMNFRHGDLIFGTLDTPASRQFLLAENVNDPTNAALALVNVVRVSARLTRKRGNAPLLILGQYLSTGSLDVRAEAAAMLDRDVIGFRPWGQQVLPLAPLALLSDPTGTTPLSWQYQVQENNGTDQYRFDRVNNVFVADPSGDGIYEFQASLALDPSQTSQANVALVFLGVTDATGVSQQLTAGVTAAQLSGFGGQLVLQQSNNQLSVPGTNVGPAAGSTQATQLFQALSQLQALAQPCIWPLYCSLDPITQQPILCGFVAARVVTVTPLANGQPLSFVLQATMVANSSAVTDAGQRGIGGIAITNPYICKVRLVE